MARLPFSFRSILPRALSALVLSVVVYGWFVRSSSQKREAPEKPVTLISSQGQWRVSDPQSLPKAPVLRVIDGDTVEILWEGQPTRLRYYGVNTPERKEACFAEASAANAQWVAGGLRLVFEPRRRDRYNRLLAYAFTDDGLSIDSEMVAQGFGRAWRRDGRWKDEIITAETEARLAQRGCLWSTPTPRRQRRKSKRVQTFH